MARPVQKHVHGKAGSYRRAKPALRIAAPDGVESPEALGTVRSLATATLPAGSAGAAT